MVIDKKKWNSLPPDIQEAITRVSGKEAARFFGANYFDSAKAGVLKKAKDTGHSIVEQAPPADELKKWKAIRGEPLWESWVKKMEPQGHSKSREILDTTLSMVK